MSKEKKRDNKGIFVRLCGYVMRYWYLFVPCVIITLLSNQLALLGPKFSGDAIDALAAVNGVDFQIVIKSVLKMAFCYITAAVLSYLLATMMVFMGQKIVYAMRTELFEKLTRLPISYFDAHQAGDIISRISYDIDTINSTLSHDLMQIMTSLYTVIGSLVFMIGISKPMIAVFVITMPCAVLFTRFRSKRIRPLFSERSKRLGEMNGYAEEMLSGARSIGAYDRQEEIARRFNEKNKETMDAYYKADYYGCTMGPTVNFINNLSISLVMILGGILYLYSQNGVTAEGSMFFITLGGVAQFVQYSRKFAGPINEFANILSEFQSAFSAAERVFSILDEKEEKSDNADAVCLDEVMGEVRFENMFFGYVSEKLILKNISFDAEKGQTIAIVGPTGAGKTTIINLLMRFYDVNDGKITLDGHDIRSVTRKSLRGAYTMVLQDTWLFCGSIFDNIAYGREDATIEEVQEAAKAAKIDGFIRSLPDGYDTILTDDGINISKGQRQLITIARAIISNSKMLILDEATSNVDSRTEIKIQRAMNEMMEGRTAFVIAHRLSTIQNADVIIVIKDGEISEMGNHEELIKRGGFYASMYNSQFG